MYRGTGVSHGVRRTTWDRSLKNWELQMMDQIPCFEEFFWRGNTLGLVPASLPHALGYACTFYAPTSPPPTPALVGNCSATRCSVAAPPPGARQGFGGPMHPRHPPAVAGREVRQGSLNLGGCSCDTPATHSELRNEPRQGCSYTVERDRGGCVASAPLRPPQNPAETPQNPRRDPADPLRDPRRAL